MSDTVTPPPAPDAQPPTGAPAPQLSPEQVAELLATVATLKTENDAAKAAAKAAEDAKLTDAQRAEKDRKDWQAQVDADRAKLKQDRRSLALDKLGVLPKFAAFAPDVDPTEPAGAAALEKWAKDYPEMIKPVAHPAQPVDVPEGSMLHKILTGAAKSPFMTTDGFRRLLGR